MKKCKKCIAMITILCVSVAMFSICPMTVAETENAAVGQIEETPLQPQAVVESLPETDPETHTYAYTTIASTPVRMAPVWTAETVETFSAGKEFNILHREYDYYYIQYDSSDILKRGYVPTNCTTVVCNSWCNHTVFNPGENSSGTAQNVLYRPSGSAVCGTIAADEGKTANKTLIVLSRLGNYYFIQYITNTSNNGSERILWKRGWVPVSTITVEPPTSISKVEGKSVVYIQNVGTGRYLDVPSYNAADGANIHMWDFHGGDNQEWTLTPRTDASGATYVTISTCQKNSTDTTMVLAVKDALSIINTRIDLAVKGEPPSKDQEFYITQVPGTTDEYFIDSRLTGNYLQFGVYHDQTGNGGPVLNKYPYTTAYNRWRIIPVYEEGEDYEYLNSGIPSSINNGVKVSFDITNIIQADNSGTYVDFDFEEYTRAGIKAWESDSWNFTLDITETSDNKVIFDGTSFPSSNGGPTYGDMTPYVYANTNKLAWCEIKIYYLRIRNKYGTAGLPNAWKSTVAHEVGHALSLGDMDENNQAEDWPVVPHSIMSYGRDRTVVIAPHNCDVAGVKKNYMN